MKYENCEHPVQEILGSIIEITGFPAMLVEDTSIGSGYLESCLDIFRKKRFTIRYNPKSAFMDHILAHECGHIIRIWPSLENSTYKTMIHTDKNIEMARKILIPDLVSAGYQHQQLIQSSTAFFKAGLNTVFNTPSDIRIERWLRENYPDLIDVQNKHLLSQMKALGESMPRYVPKAIQDIYDSARLIFTSLLQPLVGEVRIQHFTIKNSREILKLFDATPDDGYESDLTLVDRWAEIIGIRYWYEWQSILD